MSDALSKNAQAMQSLLGSEALAGRLSAIRIAVVTPEGAMPQAGALLGDVLADVLARLWPNINFSGHDAHQLLATATSAARSGGGDGNGLAVQWSPPYDCVVSIGCDAPVDSRDALRIGANGWVAEIGGGAACGSDANPAGPAFAAAMASAQVFLRIFEPELTGMGVVPLAECRVDLQTLFDARGIDVAPLNVGETHVFGVGAVTHGMVWLLEKWPARIEGLLDLVDQDKYGRSNGQRYAFMRPQDKDLAKVDVVAARLNRVHPGLAVPHTTDLNSYCASRGYEVPLRRAVAGLDSAEARRQLALKLPERTVNMWTEGVRVGAGRYLPGPGSACLACDYLEETGTPSDEVAELSRNTGLRPDIVRSLLDSGRGLTEQEASTVAAKWQMAPAPFVGQPLRSALPVLCATGKLQLQNNAEAVDVPFSFASFFAGIAGFMMLLKDVYGPARASSEGWTQHILKKPTPHMLRLLPARQECVCCPDLTRAFSSYGTTGCE